jgi:hypothetical protein
MSSNLITHPPTSLSDLVDCYNSTLAALLNKHAPLTSTILHPKSANHWFTPAINKLKHAKCHLERVWSKYHSIDNLKLVCTASDHYHAAILILKHLQLFSLNTSFILVFSLIMIVPLLIYLLLSHLLIFHLLLLSQLTEFPNYCVSLPTQTVTWILSLLLFLNSTLQFFYLQLPKS